jgi:hypothetical protein
MPAQDFDDRDAKFTGILVEPLRPGDNGAWKLPALCDALGVETRDEALLMMARRNKVPGFLPERRRKRKRAGRPNLFSVISEANGLSGGDRMPDWVIADQEKRLFARMEAIRAAAIERGQKMKVLEVAFQVSKEKEIGGSPNFFHVDDEVAEETCDVLVQSIAALFTHRTQRRQQDEATQQAFRQRVEQEVRAWLKPHWPQIKERLIKEAAEREAAGESEESILADLPQRAREIASEIAHRFP